MPEIDRPDAPYLQIARHIRDQITLGHLPEGAKVPSARQICVDFHVAMSTAMKALNALQSEGLIRSTRGSGTVVDTSRLHRSARDGTISVIRTGRIYPPGHYAANLHADLIPTPDRIAVALGLDTGTQVIRRSRTTFNAADQPLSMSVSWFDGSLVEAAPLLLVPERILQGTARYVQEQTGRARSSREKLLMSAAAATDEEAEALRIEPESPVLRGRNWYWDTAGAVIEYGESTAGPHLETSFEYTIEQEETP
jgi:DNA-binding GntR family transcriptional regulator